MIFTIKYYIMRLLSLLDFIFPKRSNYIAFSSFPDLSDNAFGMFLYLSQNYPNNYYIWLLSDINMVEIYKQKIFNYTVNSNLKIVFLKKNSIRGIYYYFISKYIFFTHGLYPGALIPKRHILVNLWHGMPLKNIAYLDGLDKKYIPLFTYSIATSKFYRDIMSKAFNVDKDRVIISGQPRNDLMFLKYKGVERIIFENILKKDEKNIIWLPTYRKSILGDIRSDGEYSDMLTGVSYEDLLKLDLMLLEQNINLVIKLHPMDSLNKNSYRNFKKISFIKNSDLDKCGVDLYSVLRYTDLLITDYSSIYIDYMLMNKKILFFIVDIEKYSQDRGFIFESFSTSYLCGKTLQSFQELYNSLLDLDIDRQESKFKYREIYNDNDIEHPFSKNIIEEIFKVGKR